MNLATRNSATTQAQIIIDWVALSSPENGDSAIIAYNLQWYMANSMQWVDLYGVLP